MIKKIDYLKVAPAGAKLLLDTEKYLNKETTIESSLKELIKIRASQINGCAHCLDMHTRDALKLGETSQRIFLISTWQETNLFTPKEQIVLEFVEKVTLIADYHLDEDIYEELHKYFTDKDIVDIMFIITQINTWNRMNIVFNRLEV